MDRRKSTCLPLNVWIRILEKHLIGPQFQPPKLNGDTHFLEEVLLVLLEMKHSNRFISRGGP